MLQGINGFIRYELENTTSPFELRAVDNYTAELVVKDSEGLDRETTPEFVLQVNIFILQKSSPVQSSPAQSSNKALITFISA